MQNGPDPDSTEMGQLVDQWLVSLRKGGMNTRQLAGWVRRLAHAANHGWVGCTPGERKALRAFFEWHKVYQNTPSGNGHAP